MKIEIKCAYDELVDPRILKEKAHPKNANEHSQEQIERMALVLQYQGWRNPVRLSTRSDFITAGHMRIDAAIFLGLDEIPVDNQDYLDEDQEVADINADNELARWATTNYAKVNSYVKDFDPGFNLKVMGFKRFEIEPADKEPKKKKPISCPSCGNEFTP